jgi:hypothetical protein
MVEQLCRCCARTNVVPEQAEDAFVCCPDCGQVLAAPSPWFSRNIPLCDTRPMIAWPNDGHAPFAPVGTVLVPWELTCQVGKVSRYTPGHLIPQGLCCTGMGILFLAMPFLMQPGDLFGWLGPLVGLLMLVMGVFSLQVGIRKMRRSIKARVVRLGESLPAEAYHLGSPVALHQVRKFLRVVYISSGFLSCVIAGFCGAMLLSGQIQDHRIGVIAFLGWPTGLYMIWQGMKLQAKRILVFARGLVSFDQGRTVTCRWDQIEGIWIELKEVEGNAPQPFVLTLRRNDGEKLVFTFDTEYIENQLVARVQYEHCACMLPSMQASLDRGGRLEFGPLQVGRDGIHWKEESFAWNEIRCALLDRTKVKITGDNRNWTLDVAAVPNLTILLALIRQRSGCDGGGRPTSGRLASSQSASR